MSLRKLTGFLVAIFVLSSAGIVLLLRFANVLLGSFSLELAKSLLHLATASVVGSVVSLLTAEYQRERTRAEQERERERTRSEQERERARQELERQQALDRRLAENRDEFLKGILAELGESYVLTKKARRLLRAATFRPPQSEDHAADARINMADYDVHLRALNDVQLDLETIVREIETNERAFGNASEVSAAVHAMEKYLKGMVSEYEKSRGHYGALADVRVAELKRLGDFVSSGASDFLSEFVEGRRRVEAAIRADLLHPQFVALRQNTSAGDPPDVALPLTDRAASS